MKVLITGSSGYIGSHLSYLLRDDCEVHGLDIRRPQIDIHKFYQKDIKNSININEEYDAVIHLAAKANVSESVRIPTEYYNTNVTGTLNVLQDITTKNFVFASTGTAETPQSPYGLSKRICEDIIRERSSNYTIFRFYNVIGSTVAKSSNPDALMYNLLKATETKEFTIFGYDYNTFDGTCLRDYVHVMEICSALKAAIYKPSNQVESLGHGRGHSVIQIVELFKTINNVEFEVKYAPRRDGDLASNVLDNPSSYMENLYTIEDTLRI